MQGTKEFCDVFRKAEQIDRLYFLPHYHARGKTFRIYLLPEGENVLENHGINPPLNKDAVEVFGIVSGDPGWTESYGWIHPGPWVQDAEALCTERASLIYKAELARKIASEAKATKEMKRVEDLLADY